MSELCLSDGAKLHYSDLGQGRPILLVHGFGMSGESFWPQDELSKIGRLIIPDLRGCGKSQSAKLNPASLNINRLGDDLFELIAQLGLEDIIYVGWSMGVLILWSAATRHSFTSISEIIALDMTPKVANEKDWKLGIKGLQSDKTDIGNARFKKVVAQMRDDWSASVPRMVARIPASSNRDNDEAKLIEQKLCAIANNNNGRNSSRLWHSLMESDVRKNLETINTHHTIIYGSKSQLYAPDTSKFVARTLPNADLVCFENSGHAPHLEEAKKFNAIIAEILQTPNQNTTNSAQSAACVDLSI